MLDQLSNGRLEVGVGRGSSPYELGYFGVDAADVRQALHRSLPDHPARPAIQGNQLEGEIYKFKNVPVVMEMRAEAVSSIVVRRLQSGCDALGARNGLNIVCNGPSAPVRAITDTYRREWNDASWQWSEVHASDGPWTSSDGRGNIKEAFEIGRRAFSVSGTQAFSTSGNCTAIR